LPELDSIAVVGLLAALEERFGLSIADDEIEGSLFATVGSFTRFVQAKLEA
jgi:acyl carrier protein